MLATQLHVKGSRENGQSGEIFQLTAPPRALVEVPGLRPSTKLLEVLKVYKALFERRTNIIILRSFATSALNAPSHSLKPLFYIRFLPAPNQSKTNEHLCQ